MDTHYPRETRGRGKPLKLVPSSPTSNPLEAAWTAKLAKLKASLILLIPSLSMTKASILVISTRADLHILRKMDAPKVYEFRFHHLAHVSSSSLIFISSHINFLLPLILIVVSFLQFVCAFTSATKLIAKNYPRTQESERAL